MEKLFTILIIVLGFWQTVFAGVPTDFHIQGTMEGTPLGTSVEFLIDRERRYDESTIRSAPVHEWEALTTPYRNFGHIHAPVWLRFRVINESVEPRSVYFENNFSLTDRLTLLDPESMGGGLQTLGDRVPRTGKETRYRNPVFVRSIPPGAHPFHVKIDTSELVTVAWKVWDPDSFHQSVNRESMVIGLLFGITVALLCYNTILFLSTRVSLLKPYCFYVLFYILVQFSLLGVSQLLITDPAVSEWIANSGFRLFLALTIYAALAFMRLFLDLAKIRPRLDKITVGWLRILLLLMIYQLAEGPEANMLNSAALSLSALHFVLCCIIVVRDGYRPARILLLAWMLILGGSSVTSMADLGLLNVEMGQALVWHFGAGCLEMILLSLAIGEWWREERQRRRQEAVQAETIRVAIQSRQDHAFDQLKKIIYPHQLERIMDGQQLEQTMPVGKETAAVIAFDVVASSRVDHETIQEFLRLLFAQCHATMMKNYQPHRFEANAYRIKETGDGFLCSIGHPFKTPDGQALAEVAVQVAQDFVQLFYRVLDDFPALQHLTCCCGIAMDRVESFFPKEGVQVYDLYGRAIVLATRYEALRKEFKIFPPEFSYIILQDRVYRGLPKKARDDFEVANLAAAGIKVRDDAAAAHCYFQKIKGSETPSHIHKAL